MYDVAQRAKSETAINSGPGRTVHSIVLRDPVILALLLFLIRLPKWSREWLAFATDLRAFRKGNGRKRQHIPAQPDPARLP